MDYYERAGLTPYLDKLGFNLVGYGCTTCIGNSGPLPEEVSRRGQRARPRRGLGAVRQPQLRGPDQPGRQDELPGLAAAGGGVRARRHDGHRPRRPSRSAPTPDGNARLPARHLARRRGGPGRHRQRDHEEMFTKDYADVFAGDERWQSLPTPTGKTFDWDPDSTYVRKPPYFEGMEPEPSPVDRHRRRPGAGHARRLGHHRPHLPGRLDQGRLARPGGTSPSTAWSKRLQLLRLAARQPRGDDPRHVRQHPAAQPAGAGRRGRLHAQLTARGEPQTSIYDAAEAYAAAGVPLVVLAGKEYGSGSSRDWAAKGTALLGVRRSSPSPTSASTART